MWKSLSIIQNLRRKWNDFYVKNIIISHFLLRSFKHPLKSQIRALFKHNFYKHKSMNISTFLCLKNFFLYICE